MKRLRDVLKLKPRTAAQEPPPNINIDPNIDIDLNVDPNIDVDLRAPPPGSGGGGGGGPPHKTEIERRRERGDGAGLMPDKEWKKSDQKP